MTIWVNVTICGIPILSVDFQKFKLINRISLDKYSFWEISQMKKNDFLPTLSFGIIDREREHFYEKLLTASECIDYIIGQFKMAS